MKQKLITRLLTVGVAAYFMLPSLDNSLMQKYAYAKSIKQTKNSTTKKEQKKGETSKEKLNKFVDLVSQYILAEYSYPEQGNSLTKIMLNILKDYVKDNNIGVDVENTKALENYLIDHGYVFTKQKIEDINFYTLGKITKKEHKTDREWERFGAKPFEYEIIYYKNILESNNNYIDTLIKKTLLPSHFDISNKKGNFLFINPEAIMQRTRNICSIIEMLEKEQKKEKEDVVLSDTVKFYIKDYNSMLSKFKKQAKGNFDKGMFIRYMAKEKTKTIIQYGKNLMKAEKSSAFQSEFLIKAYAYIKTISENPNYGIVASLASEKEKTDIIIENKEEKMVVELEMYNYIKGLFRKYGCSSLMDASLEELQRTAKKITETYEKEIKLKYQLNRIILELKNKK